MTESNISVSSHTASAGESVYRSHSRQGVILSIMAGILICCFAIIVSDLKLKFIVAGLLGCGVIVALGSGFLLIAQDALNRFVYFFIFAFALGIPFNLDKNFFYRPYVGVCSVDVSMSLLSVMALYALFCFGGIQQTRKTLFRCNMLLTAPILLYIAAGVLSLLNAEFPDLTVLELIRLATLFIIFFLVMNFRSNKMISVFMFCLGMGVILQALIAFYQYKTGHTLGLGVFGEKTLIEQDIGYVANRATGTIGHPNILAYFFEILIPCMFAMLVVERSFFLKLWYGCCVFLGVIGLFTTLSRAAWLTLPFSMGVVFLVLFKDRLWKLKTFMFLFFGATLLLIILAFAYPTIERRFTHTDYGSAKARTPMNIAALSIVRQFPVIGVGLNNCAAVFKRFDTTGHARILRGVAHVVHNMYLQIWLEVGLIGLLMFLYIFIAAAVIAWRLLFRVSQWRRGVLIGVLCGLMAQGFHCFFDPGFKTMMNMCMLVYGLIGIIGAVSLLHEEDDALAVKEAEA
jgi:putative inorganic carbon (hco3(-)) transporter